ncbi:hypothetical protein GCM10009544_01870 [Streptomyces stramineus]|uniref:Uncharacterized protein n=1 Tax=Streptomyces stramineus TaxID=173861 RepID=A0ABP3J5F6_9ACTN
MKDLVGGLGPGEGLTFSFHVSIQALMSFSSAFTEVWTLIQRRPCPAGPHGCQDTLAHGGKAGGPYVFGRGKRGCVGLASQAAWRGDRPAVG